MYGKWLPSWLTLFLSGCSPQIVYVPYGGTKDYSGFGGNGGHASSNPNEMIGRQAASGGSSQGGVGIGSLNAAGIDISIDRTVVRGPFLELVGWKPESTVTPGLSLDTLVMKDVPLKYLVENTFVKGQFWVSPDHSSCPFDREEKTLLRNKEAKVQYIQYKQKWGEIRILFCPLNVSISVCEAQHDVREYTQNMMNPDLITLGHFESTISENVPTGRILGFFFMHAENSSTCTRIAYP